MEKSIHSAEYQQLCALLRQLRLDAGLTQVEVARRLGEPQSFVSKYESGERRLDIIELRRVAVALGTGLRSIAESIEQGTEGPK
ncbi:helix-turn-helix domain-containing protein [Rhodococcus hoagii]|nr:helix-turn-helix domain-containing protein [Prescottella equi]NKS74586.1 helix-turn-helix domain-containing protein [Prescottella equi]NKZ88554.1 helix-turn-helix domain-containing protein [Prescottella equi]